MDEFKKITPSENILQLRKLTEQICSVEKEDNLILNELTFIINKWNEAVSSSKTQKTKLKNYENMFLEIKKLID